MRWKALELKRSFPESFWIIQMPEMLHVGSHYRKILIPTSFPAILTIAYVFDDCIELYPAVLASPASR